jgi:AbiU2
MAVTREDFEVKINEVVENLYLSHFHLKIHEKMTDEQNARLKEYPPFFAWSRMANYEAGVLRLTRAYDQDSLGLLKIINIIQSDYRFWNIPEPLNKHQLEQDQKFVSPQENELVKGLLQLRNKVISHTDSRLFPKRNNYNLIQEMYGGELIFLPQGRITTEEIEKLPTEEKERVLNEIGAKVDLAIEEDNSKILGVKTPSFNELYQLTSKGIEICNRYMLNLGIPIIELKLEGINE